VLAVCCGKNPGTIWRDAMMGSAPGRGKGCSSSSRCANNTCTSSRCANWQWACFASVATVTVAVALFRACFCIVATHATCRRLGHSSRFLGMDGLSAGFHNAQSTGIPRMPKAIVFLSSHA